MITAMTLILLVLATFALVVLVGYAIDYARSDGYGRRSSPPPRSHVPDLFDPTRGRTA